MYFLGCGLLKYNEELGLAFFLRDSIIIENTKLRQELKYFDIVLSDTILFLSESQDSASGYGFLHNS